MFDRDVFPSEQIKSAFHLANQEHIQIAFSNEAFELWYVLHFDYLNTAITRQDYCERLARCLGHEYRKNIGTTYDELLPRQVDAIRNARRLLEQYNPHRPVEDNPSTTVHLLVEQLNRFASP